MMQIFDCEQGTPEWFAARLGIPTASMFSTVMAKGQGKTRRTYMLKLAGEILTGQPMESYTNDHMERGKDMEAEARDLYSFMTDASLTPVGFIKNDVAGASPDSLIGDNGVLEIKTKLPHLQIDVILRDRMPTEHRAQVQGQLWVSGRQWCDFVSYWPGLPLFVKRVDRDEEYISDLAAEVDAFGLDLAEIVARIQPDRDGALEEVWAEFNRIKGY